MLPSFFALGNLLDSQLRQVEVWNARDDAQALSAIQALNPDGTEISGNAMPPASFGPLESRIYNVSISSAGSAALNAVFTWVFPAEQPTLTVTAVRVIAMTFSPDWSDPPEEQLTWKTDVLRAYEGLEQRIQLLGKARRNLAFSYLFEDARQGSIFQSLVWGWQHREFAVPVWMDQAWLGLDLEPGAVVIPMATSFLDLAADQAVMLWGDHDEWEIVEVDTVTLASLNLKQPTKSAWPTGTRVVPMRLGHMPKSVEWKRDNALMAGARVEWSLDPTVGIGINRLAPSGLPLYRGYEVLTEEPDWSLDVGESAERDIDAIDFGTGLIDYDAHTDAPEFSRPFNWLIKGREAIARFMGFIDARRGRCIPFWLPTYSRDMEQSQDASASDLSVRIRNVLYSTHIVQHHNRCDLAFYPLAGAPIFRRITGSAPGGMDHEWITLDQSFGQARATSDWRCISYLSFVRLDQDSLRMVWETDDLLRASFRVKEVLL
ncbi:hypothetical protein [Geothrix sp. PMB-07]|uniref:hypothetical protein n=1 Tax=Geothrix sp. PMB-07 TaxID=3068640 RepID=UPI00274268CA|nr:hypothetical protein [Geothrix sp. PMB-07]WLT32268.1 hypothetical protein Q9293_02835 [Geothrix sp. PMB-07]